MDCLFCKIIKGDIPSTIIFENESILGFKDIYPQAKEHFLFISKKHSHDISDLMKTNPSDLTDIFQGIQDFTKGYEGLKDGFRVVTNNGSLAGQTVFHTHFHVIGGEQLGSFGK